jgi:hypothetical protein
MNSMQPFLLAVALAPLFLITLSRPLYSQSFDTVGTRAAGMGGAFVAVADDASAAYWNPGGFASGSYFSLVLDRTSGRTDLSLPFPGSRSGTLLALGAPALGLSYYRTRHTTLGPPLLIVATDGVDGSRNISGVADVRARSLVTHQVGATLVQSIFQGVAVGTTLKVVRGIAAAENRLGDREALLDDTAALTGRASNTFDADIGVMASFAFVKAGLTVRNVREPEFDTPDGVEKLTLERQVRAGIALLPAPGWTIAADLDLLRTEGLSGDVRDVAIGAEGRVHRRVFLRSGFRMNTISDVSDDRARAVTFGGSYALTASVLVDAQVTTGSDRVARGWGIAGRFVY